MADIPQLIVDQNSKIEARKKDFADAASAFADLFDPGKVVDISLKKKALLNLYQKAKVYFSCVESCIVEGCVAGAFDHPAWLEDQAGSAEKVLSGLTTLFSSIRKHRNELGFTSDAFEPTGNIFQNMQGILALCRPEKAKELKQQFIKANLPYDCFDKPLKYNPMKLGKNNPSDDQSGVANNTPPQKPPAGIAKWVAGVLSVCSAGATVYGLYADKRIAVFAFIGMIFAMVLLFVVARAAKAVSQNKGAWFYDALVKVLVLFIVLYFIVTTCCLFPSLIRWLTEDSTHITINPSITNTLVAPATLTNPPFINTASEPH